MKVTISEKILKEMESKLRKKLEAVDKDMNSDPVSELIKVHIEFGDWIKNTKGADRLSEEAQSFIKDLELRQQRQEKRRKSWDWQKLLKSKIDLEMELNEITNKLYYCKMKRENY